MKYIRTKYGISELYDEQHIKDFVAVKCPLQFKGYRIVSKDNVVKQADTVEELCDGFIVEEKGKKDNWFVMSIYEFKQMDLKDRQYLVKGWNYYGYIKTDKGLIYVAKMNEEGELELL